MPATKRGAVCALAFALLAACGGGGTVAGRSTNTPSCVPSSPSTGPAPWPAPCNPLDLARQASLTPTTHEFLAYHVHAHLDVFVNGSKVIVPAGIGININDPAVRHGPGPSYGGISMCAQPCISPLHTHDTSGVLHTESEKSHPNTLGEFFVEWNVRLDTSCVGGYCSPQVPIHVYINGLLGLGNPADQALQNLREIAIVIGTPPISIPSRFPSGVTA